MLESCGTSEQVVFSLPLKQSAKMQNEEGQNMDLYIPRNSATNRLITAKDHASVQLNVGHLDEAGRYTGQFSTFALCGYIRAQGDADSALDRLRQKKKVQVRQHKLSQWSNKNSNSLFPTSSKSHFQLTSSSSFLKSQMSHRPLDSRRAIDSCTFQLHSWKPFHLPHSTKTLPLDSADSSSPKPYQYSTTANGAHSKRPCLSNRATTSFSIDISRLSLIDDDRSVSSGLRFIDRKRLRQRGGSRSVSGRSSDRSGTQRRCCSIGVANGTCSDFPVGGGGTDSSGELFLNGGGEGNWASDVSEAAGKGSRREIVWVVAVVVVVVVGQIGSFDSKGNESGYGSEPGIEGMRSWEMGMRWMKRRRIKGSCFGVKILEVHW
ncbi:hypothetical protein RHGRI_011512 [Rhododendron griersonianum]|uniref:Uncharacterized protein n=1 Tax=Rhododendron griersonianum TaxID=479676 RepID=A0AAV6KM57_9ERIC|nr:hypothetical protein RHGRI_011512 [Rhododendron griersonianum]